MTEDRKIALIVGGVLCTVVTIVVICSTVPFHFSYVEYDELAFKRNKIDSEVDTSEVFHNGRYPWGINYEPVTFPSTFQRITFASQDLAVFSEQGLEFFIEADVYYRLDEDNLEAVFDDFATSYEDRFTEATRAAITNQSPEFTVDNYIENRTFITQALFENVNRELQSLHIQIEPFKFLLRRVQFPLETQNRFLQTAIQEQINEQERLQQELTLIQTETQRQVSEIDANTTLINATASASADAIVQNAESAAFRIVQEAIGQGLNILFTSLNVTSSADRAALMQLFTINDGSSPQVILGNANPIISF